MMTIVAAKGSQTSKPAIMYFLSVPIIYASFAFEVELLVVDLDSFLLSLFVAFFVVSEEVFDSVFFELSFL